MYFFEWVLIIYCCCPVWLVDVVARFVCSFQAATGRARLFRLFKGPKAHCSYGIRISSCLVHLRWFMLSLTLLGCWLTLYRSRRAIKRYIFHSSLVRGVPHRCGGTPFGAFQPEIWGISLFDLCSVFLCYKSQCLDHLSELENDDFRKCEEPYQMVLHIRHSTPFSSYVKWVTKTQEITKSKFGENCAKSLQGCCETVQAGVWNSMASDGFFPIDSWVSQASSTSEFRPARLRGLSGLTLKCVVS